jgi:hypothetical protein
MRDQVVEGGPSGWFRPVTGGWGGAHVRIGGILHIVRASGGTTVCSMEIVGDDYVLFPEDEARCRICTGLWATYRRAAKGLKRPDD